ncbi:MAG: hypothetical protein V9G04_16630 [Nocardioides sp.]|jgi:hypothetical protein
MMTNTISRNRGIAMSTLATFGVAARLRKDANATVPATGCFPGASAWSPPI